MFKKVLIANRGEIACRAVRTLKRMNIQSLAVYSAGDVDSLHVRLADEAVHIGEAPAQQSYLSVDKLLQVAKESGACAVFPGYGFLSENADFAERCAAQGVVFIGPTPAQLREFGLKHRARELAQAASVPLLPGSDLVSNAEEAAAEAARIGYPVMLKSTGGGGGIGLLRCDDPAQLAERFETAVRLGANNFGQAGVFLEKFVERARHIEVQIFGDGRGNVVALGERDCSAQRRNQKVVEETPAPNLSDSVREGMRSAAVSLGRSCRYLSAGTVEFVYDLDTEAYYFLEVNTRLQVEHGVTELCTGIDLVEWMLLTAQGNPPELENLEVPEAGHAIQARLYAEAPAKNFRPSSGLLTRVTFPEPRPGLRIDTWIDTGVEVTAFYDPLLAKIMVHAPSREEAIDALRTALEATVVDGVETNRAYLCSILALRDFRAGSLTTRGLSDNPAKSEGVEVEAAGTLSTVQDFPGRLGYWHVGVPPSGAMDSLALRLGNRVLGNPEGSAAVEMTMTGMTVVFHEDTLFALSGANMNAALDGVAVANYRPVAAKAGQRLALGKIIGPGARTYLCVRNGFAVPSYLGSSSTFTLGRFGGHGGRALRPSDVLRINRQGAVDEPVSLDESSIPKLSRSWEVSVTYGPHGAPDFFTDEDIETFFSTQFEVHYNSARTGVRLIGPKPKWARSDGGEAGLHPSNIHDNAYAFGAVDYTGDMPIILGPDGPSLGGFVCPAVVVQCELWKLGQLAPGDRVRFVPVDPARASEREVALDLSVTSRIAAHGDPLSPTRLDPVVLREPASARSPEVVYRTAGDRFLLVEYGEGVLDLELRLRVHSLMTTLEAKALPGVIDLTPGIRSLMVHYDSRRLSRGELIAELRNAEKALPPIESLRVNTRVVHLPLSWDDEATQLAIRKYTQLVRKDAPWAPSNIEFIRRINGLKDEQAVKDIVFGASYIVLGLGDVYLGAPVATPIDPRHRLVTTKYNPARTWTPENAVGIGGAYMCIYGMEGPGGYQFVGRTLQVYNRFRTTRDFEAGKPWLLRFFDQIRFHPVSSQELLRQRDAFAAGRLELDISEEVFDLSKYRRFLADNAESIAAFKRTQQRAFEDERARWVAQGLLHFSSDAEVAPDVAEGVPAGQTGVLSPVPGSVWKVEAKCGQRVAAGDKLLILESMKMEIVVEAPVDGVVSELRAVEGKAVNAGQILIVLSPSGKVQAERG